MNQTTDIMSLLKTLPVGLLILDNSGDILEINSAAASLLGIGDDLKPCESGLTKQEYVELLDTKCRDAWSRLLDTLDESAKTETWHTIASIKGSLLVRVTRSQTCDDAAYSVVILEPAIGSAPPEAPERSRALVHEMNNCLAVATTNAELIKINLERQDFSRLATSARLISDNLFRLAELIQM